MGVFFGQDNVVAKPATVPVVSSTVTVGCRIINGLTINLDFSNFSRQVKLNGPSSHGDFSFDSQGRQTRSGNSDNHSFTSAQAFNGAFGKTVIKREEWDAIQSYHRDADWLQRGMVFAL